MVQQLITLTRSVVDAVDLGHLVKYIDWHDNRRYFNQAAGQEHYKLLAYLSTQLQCKRIIDIGSYLGHSCNALSYDVNREVLSFDIADWIPCGPGTLSVKDKPNVRCLYTDYMDDLADLVKDCDLVMIDIDHTGQTERTIMERLREIKYTGLVFLDDTRLNPEMQRFYNDIPEVKVDVTAVGHWSGSAIVVFDPTRFSVVLTDDA